MNVLLCLSVAVFVLCSGDVTGQFTAPPPTCPGDTFTFRCTVTGDMSGETIWRVGGNSECNPLRHRSSSSSICGPGDAFTARPGTGFGNTSATSFSSTLSGTATPELNGTLVECFGPARNVNPGNRVGGSNLLITGPPSTPTLSCVGLSDVSGAVNVTVSWTLSGGDSAEIYLINITTNAPQTPYEGLLNITTGSVTQHELTGFMADYKYNITVRGVNCGSQEGNESEPLTIRPQDPAVVSHCNITVVFDHPPGKLLFIRTTWDSMPDQVDLDPEEMCPPPRANITGYQIRFQANSSLFIENVTSARCTAGRCNYTFYPPSNPPSSYDSVSVAAENVVGVGAARTCSTQAISTTNNLIQGGIENANSPGDAFFFCNFLSGFTGSTQCKVEYGTDSTYMNLPYSAKSTETGTAGNTVSSALRERLNSSTEYYYTVSAVSGDITVEMRRTLITPLYSCSLMELWNLPAAGAAFLSDVSLLNDAAQYPSCDDGSVGSIVLENTTLNTATVAYFSGNMTNSTACFVCDESSGFTLNTSTNERVCQRNVTWSGRPAVCVCNQPCLLGWHIALIVVGAIFLVIGIVLAVIIVVWKCWKDIYGTKESTPNWNSCSQYLLAQCELKFGRIVLFATFCTVFAVIGVVLWMVVGLVVDNTTGNVVYNLSWRNKRDGLIIAGFASSIVVFLSSTICIVMCLIAQCCGQIQGKGTGL